MKTDYHIHSNFSADSEELLENIINQAIKNNFDEIAITDHLDLDFPNEDISFDLDIDTYYKKISELKEKYKDKLNIKIGIEVGLQPHLKDNFIMNKVLSEMKFDFIIGSTHVAKKLDFYNGDFFKNLDTKDQAHKVYFQEVYDNLSLFDGFSVIGHMDFIKRYGKSKFNDYGTINYELHTDIIEKILKLAIKKNIGIEVNTSGYRYGINSSTPGIEILDIYKRLGGKLITIGSDSHIASDLGANISDAKDLLKSCGFEGYYIFTDKKPHLINFY